MTTKGRNEDYFFTESGPEKLTQTMYEMINFSLAFKTMERKHLLEIRKIIEIPCAGLAAERRTSENMLKLNAFLEAKDKYDDDIHDLLELNLNFQLALSECTQNPLAKTLVNAITRSFLEFEKNWDKQVKNQF